MNEFWHELDPGLRRRLEWSRCLTMVIRVLPYLWSFLCWIFIFFLLRNQGWIDETSFNVGFGVSALALVGWIIWKRKSILCSRPDFVVRLADENPVWEPLRAFLLRPGEREYHPYFIESLQEKIKIRSQTETVFGTGPVKHYVSLVGFIFVFTLGLPMFLFTTAGPPSEKFHPPELSLSSSVVLTGETVTLSVSSIKLERAPEVRLFPSEQDPIVRTMKRSETGWYWHSHQLSRSIEGEVFFGKGEPVPFKVDAISRPRLRIHARRIEPPAYTGLPVQENVDPLEPVLPGSRIVFELQSNREFAKLQIGKQGQGIVRERNLAQRLEQSYVVREKEQFYFTGTDTYGFTADTQQVSVQIARDRRPSLSLIAPDTSSSVEGSGLLPVRLRFQDDFGLSRAEISYGRMTSDQVSDSIAVPDNQPEGEIYAQLDRDGLNLMTGDTFSFMVTVWDNDTVRGPKSKTVGPFEISVFTWQEMMRRRDRNVQGQQNQLSQMQETVKKVRSELEEMVRNEKQESWEVSRKLQQAQKALNRQEKQLRQAQQSLRNRQQQSRGLSRESLRRLSDIRKMMQEHASESLEKARESLQKALKKQLENQKLSRSDLKYSEAELEKFERDIERMHSLLEQAEPLLKMDRMARTLETMSEEQKKWSTSDEWDEKSRRQLERQKQQWEWIEEKIDELMEQTSGETRQRLEQLSKQLQKNRMSQQAQKLLQQSKPDQKRLSEYRKQTQKMRNQMRQSLQQQLAQMQQARQSLRSRLVNHWTNWFRNLIGWNKYLDDMKVPPRFVAQYELSMEPLDKAISAGIRLRKGLNLLSRLTSQIGAMSTDFPREILHILPEQIERFETIADRMKERRFRSIETQVDKTIAEQARLIHLLLQWNPSSSGQNSSPSSSGGVPSLSQLLQQQRRLTQGLMPMFGEKSVPKSLAQQFLRQQQMIRQGMQTLAQRQKQNQNILGDLEEITRQMRKSERQIENREFNKTLESRQKTILDRMEQATRSLSDEKEKKQPERDERIAHPGESDTDSITKSRYQQILEQLGDSLREKPPSERETILRFYRFWFKDNPGIDPELEVQ